MFSLQPPRVLSAICATIAALCGTHLPAAVPQVAVSSTHALALRGDGSMVGWGDNFYLPLGVPNNLAKTSAIEVPQFRAGSGVIAVAAGSHFSIALKADGSVWSWGWNNNNRLGNPANVTGAPMLVSGFGPGSGVIAIAAAESAGLALKSDGTVWMWGENTYGLAGDGTAGLNTNRATPVLVPGLPPIRSIHVGRIHAVAVAHDGTLWGWGQQREGQFCTLPSPLAQRPSPDVRSTPARESLPVGVTPVPGAFATLFVRTDGGVDVCGSGTRCEYSGNFGGLSPTGFSTIPGAGGVRSVAAGRDSNYFLQSDGSVRACGINDFAQLGNGTTAGGTTPVSTPVSVPGLSNTIWVAAGGTTTVGVAVTREGNVFSWGGLLPERPAGHRQQDAWQPLAGHAGGGRGQRRTAHSRPGPGCRSGR
jgi:hypothetical protein